MIRTLKVGVFTAVLAVGTCAQTIPPRLQGSWVIRRILPTRTISCWSYKQAHVLLGTRIEYRADSLRWKDRTALHPAVAMNTIGAQQFHDESSGGGANDSQVTFAQLGIRTPSAVQVVLTHADIKPIDGADELQGDNVLIKDRNTIIFAVCNVYFEAQRFPALTSAHR